MNFWVFTLGLHFGGLHSEQPIWDPATRSSRRLHFRGLHSRGLQSWATDLGSRNPLIGLGVYTIGAYTLWVYSLGRPFVDLATHSLNRRLHFRGLLSGGLVLYWRQRGRQRGKVARSCLRSPTRSAAEKVGRFSSKHPLLGCRGCRLRFCYL